MQESPPSPESATPNVVTRPRSGSGHGGSEFRGVGGDLLRTYPSLNPPPGVLAEYDDLWRVLCPCCFLVEVRVPTPGPDPITLDCLGCNGRFVVCREHSPECLPPTLPTPPPPRPVLRGSSEFWVAHWRSFVCCPHCGVYDTDAPEWIPGETIATCRNCSGPFVVDRKRSTLWGNFLAVCGVCILLSPLLFPTLERLVARIRAFLGGE